MEPPHKCFYTDVVYIRTRMSLRLGVLLDNADIIDYRTKGEIQIVQVRSSGLTKRACKRGARKEATKYIPLPQQEVINSTKLSSPRMGSTWLFTVTEME